MFSLICAWIKGSVNNREAGDLKWHCAYYDVTVMGKSCFWYPHSSELLPVKIVYPVRTGPRASARCSFQNRTGNYSCSIGMRVYLRSVSWFVRSEHFCFLGKHVLNPFNQIDIWLVVVVAVYWPKQLRISWCSHMKTRQIWGIWNCDWPIVRKRPIWVKIGDVLYRVTLKLDGWPWKTIGYLSFAVSSFVQHFIANGEFKLELQSGNAQFGSNSMIVRAVWPWNLTYDLEKQ